MGDGEEWRAKWKAEPGGEPGGDKEREVPKVVDQVSPRLNGLYTIMAHEGALTNQLISWSLGYWDYLCFRRMAL